ncbi:MAG: hypothetical protein DI616_12970 [Paracoccus denitrificans]|uniref:Yip1 domain-containing protein n=1 Tax=Paracoccus denitrificans TaxID=266 RepID=A0A533I2B3_PARDE|nr:MAG: hypothetical protein DI616_12970 [Paracoccus denitrificans]
MTADDLIWLARLSFRNPGQAVRQLQALALPVSARWMALVISVVLSTVLMVVTIRIRPETVMPVLGEVANQPFAYAMLQLSFVAISAWLLTGMARAVGGRGDFGDVILVIAWIEFLLLIAQLLQLILLIVSPLLASLFGLASMIMITWVSVQLLRAVFGIANPLIVIMGLVAAFLLTAFLLSIIAAAFGLIPELPAEVSS